MGIQVTEPTVELFVDLPLHLQHKEIRFTLVGDPDIDGAIQVELEINIPDPSRSGILHRSSSR